MENVLFETMFYLHRRHFPMPDRGVHILALRQAHIGDSLSVNLLRWIVSYNPSATGTLVGLVSLLWGIGAVPRGHGLRRWKQDGESQVVDPSAKEVDVVESV